MCYNILLTAPRRVHSCLACIGVSRSNSCSTCFAIGWSQSDLDICRLSIVYRIRKLASLSHWNCMVANPLTTEPELTWTYGNQLSKRPCQGPPPLEKLKTEITYDINCELDVNCNDELRLYQIYIFPFPHAAKHLFATTKRFSFTSNTAHNLNGKGKLVCNSLIYCEPVGGSSPLLETTMSAEIDFSHIRQLHLVL